MNFEVYKILQNGVPVILEKSSDFKTAVATAFLLLAAEPGHYTVCTARNTSEPILVLSDGQTAIKRREKSCLTPWAAN
jgi:hypothetical protein